MRMKKLEGNAVPLLKGIILIGCAAALVWIALSIWSSSNQYTVVNGAPPGLIAGYSDTPAKNTQFWLFFDPPQYNSYENDSSKGHVEFGYELQDVPASPTSVSFAFSGYYADNLKGCESPTSAPTLTIRYNVNFVDLPASAQSALIDLVQRENAKPLGGGTVQIPSDAAETIAENDVYTTVTIPVSPVAGGTGRTPGVGAAETVSCEESASGMWSLTPDGSRLIVPAMDFSSAGASQGALQAFSGMKVPTDDRFYFTHGSVDPMPNQTSQTYLQAAASTDAYSQVNGYGLIYSAPVSGSFVSVGQQENEKRNALLAGLLLGMASSIFIQVAFRTNDRFFGEKPCLNDKLPPNERPGSSRPK